KTHFGDARIEDMSLPFFCVSTDLVAGKTRVHRQGLLRDALRASIALPGVLPPVASADSLLVDGAVLNNLPVDVMQAMNRGPIVGIDVAVQGTTTPKASIDPPGFLGWVLRHGMRSAPPIVSLLMRTATISVDPAANRKTADLVIVPELQGVEIRDW